MLFFRNPKSLPKSIEVPLNQAKHHLTVPLFLCCYGVDKRGRVKGCWKASCQLLNKPFKRPRKMKSLEGMKKREPDCLPLIPMPAKQINIFFWKANSKIWVSVETWGTAGSLRTLTRTTKPWSRTLCQLGTPAQKTLEGKILCNCYTYCQNNIAS